MWWDSVWPLVAATAAALAALALGLLAATGPAPGWETDVVDALTRPPDAVGYPLRAVMELGTVPAALAVALVVRLAVDRWRPSLVVAAAGVSAWLVAQGGKALVGRERPSGVRLREVGDGFGFPSGHTAVAFALAVAVAAAVLPRWRWLPFLLATLVGLARMHVGAHYPLDVVGGALVGLAVALVVVTAERHARPAGDDLGTPGAADGPRPDARADDRPAV